MVGHDYPLKWLARPLTVNEPLLTMMDDWNWENVLKNAVPILKNLGVNDEQINMILVENPKRFFGY